MGLSSTAAASADHERVVSPARPLSPSNHPSGGVQYGTRLVEIAALRKDGARHISQMSVPALPVFDSAFSAFARGTILQSPDGEIPIEDLQPGDWLWTNAGSPAQVQWIGCSSFQLIGARASSDPLVRIMADTFGEGRPDSFVTLGPNARILQTPSHMRGAASATMLLTSVQEFVDGVNVIEVMPPTAVPLFHVVLDRHAVIRAGGLECETFHPGSNAMRSLSHGLRSVFLSMFPCIAHISEFGPLAHPRAPDPSH